MIAFDIAPEIRNRVKEIAIKRNISMNLLINRLIYEMIIKEDKYNKSNDSGLTK